jgi:hypothetical protein
MQKKTPESKSSSINSDTNCEYFDGAEDEEEDINEINLTN